MAAVPLLAAPTVLAFFRGGYFPGPQLIAAAAGFALVALVAVAAPWPLLPGGRPAVALAALAGYCGWTAASVGWARIQGDAAHDAYRIVLYVLALALALAVFRVPRIRSLVPDALLVGIVAVALYALGGRLFPHLIHERIGSAGSRLSQPLTYWNAMGMLCGLGALLGVVIAGTAARPLAWRAFACGATVVCGLASILTFSRGAWLSTLAGLAVCLLLSRGRSTVLAAALGIGSAACLGVLLRAFPDVLTLHHDTSHQATQGAAYAAVALAVAVSAALAFARWLPTRAGAGEMPAAPRLRRALALAVVPAVLAMGTLVATHTEQASRLPTTAARVTTFKTNRGRLWRVALDAFGNHPLIGVGSASFSVEWLRERGERQRALDAHSLYIETLVELGLVGGALLAAFIAAVALGIVAAARAAPGDPVVAAAVTVLAALAVHLGLDWDWEMPAVALVGLLLAGAAMQRAGAPIRSG